MKEHPLEIPREQLGTPAVLKKLITARAALAELKGVTVTNRYGICL